MSFPASTMNVPPDPSPVDSHPPNPLQNFMAAALEHESLKLSDGRNLSYAVYGSPVPRKTVIYMHGWPSSRFEANPWHSSCAARGIRLIAPDRPGTGLSTFQPGRKMLDWPADVLELVDNLKVDEFYILGVSGGAPYALACLRNISKTRLLGVTICSGLYPPKLGLQGMLVQTRLLFFFAPYTTRLLTFLFESFAGKASRNKDPAIFEKMLKKEMEGRPLKDRKAIEDPAFWPTCVNMSRESFRQGSEGQTWEACIYGGEWGFELEELPVGGDGIALKMYHGTDDVNVPANLARKAHELMPRSELFLKEGDCHYNYIFREVDDILEGLIGDDDAGSFMMASE